MSTRKQVPHKTLGQLVAEPGDDIAALPKSGLDSIEVTSLELDEQFEIDTDPYNRTGSHYVAALRRKDD